MDRERAKYMVFMAGCNAVRFGRRMLTFPKRMLPPPAVGEQLIHLPCRRRQCSPSETSVPRII
jgi:hypothetical protein